MWEWPAWQGVAAWAAVGRGAGAPRAMLAAFRDWLEDRLRREPLPVRPLVCVAAALAGGSAAGEWLDPSPLLAWLVAAAAVVCWSLVGGLRPTSIAIAPVIGQWLLLAAIAAGGAAWCTVRSRYFADADLAWALGPAPLPLVVEGVVVESPRRLASRGDRGDEGVSGRPSSECVLAVRSVRHRASWRPAAGRAAVVIDGEPPPLVVGTRVRVWGRGLRPPPPLNPGEFDFRERSRAARCLSVIRVDGAACVRILARPAAWWPAVVIEGLRARGIAVLERHLSPERAPLAAALLLGSRESLPREESLGFLVTGTIHILSISGLHVGFLALTLFFLLRLVAMPRGWALAAVAAATGLYMLLVRSETPVVRATLLVWTTCLGTAIGRRSPGGNALALAALLVMLLHPPELFRTGSQLSFLSTGVLVAVAGALPLRRAPDDPIERLIERSRPPWQRRLRRIATRGATATFEGAVGGAAVWAVTAPIVAARFHLVSPIALVINPIVAPLVAIAMAWGFLCLLTAAVSTTLAAACGRACDATLAAIGWLVAACAAIPGGFFWVAGPPAWWVAGWYVGIVALMLLAPPERLARLRTWCIAAIVWLVAGGCAAAIAAVVCPRPPCLRAVVAAVGHGCGILVRSPGGRCLLYDAGRLGAPGAARRAVESVLWTEGVRRLDAIVVSHADSDHFNAVSGLLERFPVGEIIVPPPLLERDAGEVAELLASARRTRVPIRVMEAGDSFALDPLCRIRALHPPGDNHSADRQATVSDNETTLVLAVEAAGRRLLLTGDVEGAAAARFVATAPGRCDVLVAPHHGSRTSLPPVIAQATEPAWVIVSGPGGGGWQEVRAAYAAVMPDGAEERVVKTGADTAGANAGGGPSGGAIAITMDAAEVRVEQFAAGRWRRLPAGSAAKPPPRGKTGGPERGSHASGSRGQAASATGPERPRESGRVRKSPAAMIASWLTTKPASSMSTPLVNP